MGDLFTEEMILGADVRRMLNISKNTLMRWRKDGKIKYIELANKRYRYPKSEIDRIMTQGMV